MSSPAIAVFAPAMMLGIEVHRTGDGEGDEVHLHAGGQGYWIARMIQTLGVDAIPCAPVGGEPGEALRSIIAADGFDARLTTMVNPNSVVIEDRRDGGRHVVATTEHPQLGRHDVDEIYSTTIGAALSAGVCVLAGTQLAPMFDPDVFRRLVTDLRRHGVIVVTDLCGDLLQKVLGVGVDIVKLSHEELVADGLARSGSREEVIRAMLRLRTAGAGSVVVSRKDRSTLACDADGCLEVRSPSLEVLDGRGGGDSMTAALAVGAARGLAFTDALRLAAAAGALNVSRHGLGTGRRDAIEDVASRVEVVPIASRGATVGDLDSMTKAELYAFATRRGVRGRSRMTRAELVSALRT